jgi:hypothetical protein
VACRTSQGTGMSTDGHSSSPARHGRLRDEAAARQPASSTIALAAGHREHRAAQRDRGQTERCSPEGNRFASDSSHPKHQAGQQTADSRQNPHGLRTRAREPGPPESRWPLERRRKGTAAGVIYRLRAGPGPCGGRRCRLRQAALVEGRWAGGWARPSAARASGVPRHRGYRASQPKTTCSPEPDCLGSGRRIMRNEMSSPIKPARIGIRSAT